MFWPGDLEWYWFPRYLSIIYFIPMNEQVELIDRGGYIVRYLVKELIQKRLTPVLKH